VAEPLPTPRVVAGRYELDAPIGKGGFAEVWRARHLALNSFVAIKFLQVASAQNELTRKRFTTEAQVTAQLKSQHAVQVFDFGVTEEGQPYLVMELLEGETLGRRLERLGRIGIVDTARLLGQSARALHRAHQLGIVHRDFKPDNIVVGADDEGRDYVKVVDFGIAKLVGDLEPSSQPTVLDPSINAPPSTFTKTGSILGTPYYMAPEQVRNASEVDLRADIWALGIVAYECLTGMVPFTGTTLAELFERIQSGKHPDPTKLEPSVPVGFNDWFDVACAPEPSRRFPDAQTAWKRLMVALECGRIELEPSIRRSLTTSGEHTAASARIATADGHAKTVEATAIRGVEARQRRAAQQGPSMTLDAHTLPEASPPAAEAPSLAPAHAPASPTKTASERTAPHAPRPGASRGPLVVSVIVLSAALGIVAWRGLAARSDVPARSDQTVPAASELAGRAPPPAPAAPSSAPPVASAPPTVVIPPLAAPLASTSTTKASVSSHTKSGASSAPAAPGASSKPSSRASPPPAAPAASPAPVAPAATIADPSSYR
jgi:serine/threonine-protein kinase